LPSGGWHGADAALGYRRRAYAVLLAISTAFPVAAAAGTRPKAAGAWLQAFHHKKLVYCWVQKHFDLQSHSLVWKESFLGGMI